MPPFEWNCKLLPIMKLKYLMMLAAVFMAVGMPQADAAPKKKKKAKVVKKAVKDDDVFEPDGLDPSLTNDDVFGEPEEEQGERSYAQKREDALMAKEETKAYLDKLRKTNKILRRVRDLKSAQKAVPELEELYGAASPRIAAEGTVTALGMVKIMEEDEDKIDVYIQYRSVAASLNRNLNKELSRIAKLQLEYEEFDAITKKMIDSQPRK